MTTEERIQALCYGYVEGDAELIQRVRDEQEAETRQWQNLVDDAAGDTSLAEVTP